MPHEGSTEVARDEGQWSVLWTHSNNERRVDEQLRGKGFDTFLPLIRSWSRRRGTQLPLRVPMFPGYLFVHHIVDKHSQIEMLKARGVVKLLGEGWARPAPVPDDEIDVIRRVADADVPVFQYPFLKDGQQVRIIDGALAGLEGILIASNPHKGLFVVSVDLLQRSVAVELESSQVVPVAARPPAAAAPVYGGWRQSAKVTGVSDVTVVP
jgi:transcription termination/antitermination protein NusG